MDTPEKLQIEPRRWYKPMQIAKSGLIVNSVNQSDYNYVLRLIGSGKLQAQNYSTGEKAFFRVLGQWIIDYKRKYEGYEG
jgi:hypothetical protein